MHLKTLREEDFGHELQQMSSLFSSGLHKFTLKTQLKTLTHIDKNKLTQVGIKDVITIISSLNASQTLLASKVFKLVKLISTVPAANAVSERSSSRSADSHLTYSDHL